MACLLLSVTACEPCAVVLGGHCSDQHRDEEQSPPLLVPYQSQPPIPLAPSYLPRGQRG